uniref:Proteinral odorant-binding protein 56d n=2 Tax=Haematobia irritans TaxID=7368 RepID=A0A1L8EDP4_HAEIR
MEMKLVIAVLCLIAVTGVYGQSQLNLSEEQKVHALQYAAACMEQEKSTTEDSVALTRGQFSGLSKNAKCFVKCFFEKAGFMKDGVVLPDVLTEKLGPNVGEDKLKAIMGKCNSVKGSDKCDTAFKLFECYYKEHTSFL